jgi:uncharacterized DUF497 family protein
MMWAAIGGFDWDEGNRLKCQAHGMSIVDVEHVLVHAETLIVPDDKHSQYEPRYIAIGRTQAGRYAFVVFTPREGTGGVTLRPISARYMHGKEVMKYEKEISHPED